MTVIINGTNGITSVNGTAAAPSVTGTDTDTGIVYGTNTVTIATGGTAGLVQDASQNISIGGSVAAQKLNVKGIVAFEAISGSTNNWVNYTYTDSTFRWNYNGSGSDELILNSNGVLSLLNASTTANGVGICFPATQSASTDANTLDDYEEGTWTPTIQFNGGSVGATYYTQVGTYRKVGSLVVAQCYLSINNKGSSTGVARIAGLPFTSTSTSNNYCAGTFWGATLATISGAPAGYMAPSSTAFTLQSLATTGTLTDLTQSNIQNSTELMITVSYQASA